MQNPSHTSMTPFSLMIMHQWLGSALLVLPSLNEGAGATKLRFSSSFEVAVLAFESPYSISSSSSTTLLHKHPPSVISIDIKGIKWLAVIVYVEVMPHLRSWMMVSASEWLLMITSSFTEQLTLFSVVNIPLTSLYAHSAIMRDCCQMRGS